MQNPLGGVLSVAQGHPNQTSPKVGGGVHGQMSSNDVNSSRLLEGHSSNTLNSNSIHNQVMSLMEPSETDKRAIYKHPLFPLMALLFERCEQVTQSPDCPLVASLKSDIQSFVQHHQQHLADLESCVGTQPEVDSLMIKAIQILWIHLLELEKVNELCKDFCTRYISCLRTKLQNEQLLHVDAFEAECAGSMLVDLPPPRTGNQSDAGSVYRSLGGGGVCDDDHQGGGHHGNHLMDNSHPVYRMTKKKATDERQMDEQMQLPMQDMAAARQPSIGLPLNADGSVLQPPAHQSGCTLPPHSSSVSPTLLASFASFDESDDDPRVRMKRGILPKQATQVMKTWLFQHLVHPYPTEDEKRQIAEQTNLSILQVNNWFINARRRILQPIVDAGNHDGSKVKKNNRAVSRIDQLSPDVSTGPAGQITGHRLSSFSKSRSESSTPTSTTTFDYDYQRTHEDSGHDNSEEQAADDHLKTSGSSGAGFFPYAGGPYFPSSSIPPQTGDAPPRYVVPEDAGSDRAAARSSRGGEASNADRDSFVGDPNYSSDRESSSNVETEEED